MTETRGELLERGWHDGPLNWDDINVVIKMRCRYHACGGSLYLEVWTKPGVCLDKKFTQCIQCGHRKEF